MSVSVLSRPISGASNWNAAGNPVLYKFRRVDVSFNSIVDSGGFARITILSADGTAYIEAGDIIYVKNNVTDIYDGYHTVTSSNFSGGDTLIVLSTAYIDATGPGIINHTTKRTDYKLNVEIFRASNDESLNDLILTFSPDSSGLMVVDVSAIVKSYISAEWSNPSAVNEVDEEASLKFYIKYQEYYDGSVQGSITSDSANPIHAVFAAMQIGSTYGGNMREYYIDGITKKFLTKFFLSDAVQGLRMWRDWPFSFSFIFPSGSMFAFVVKQYDVSSSLISTSIDSLDSDNDDSINRLKMPSIAATTKKAEAYLAAVLSLEVPSPSTFVVDWTNEDSGTSWTLAGAASINGLTVQSKILSTVPDVLLPDATGVTQRVVFTLTLPNTKQVDVLFMAYDVGNGGWNTIGILNDEIGDGQPHEITVEGETLIAYAFTKYGIRVVPNDSVAGIVSIDNVEMYYFTDDPISVTLDIDVDDVCDYNEDNVVLPAYNPIYLFWKNSLGGDAFWLFPLYHESTFVYGNGRKARRMTLFATDLTPVQWEAINELNSTGEVYQPAITELTSSVLATTKRVGQQVYIVDQDGNKTGVVVIPAAEKNRSRNVTHSIAIEIELPDVFSM